MNLLETIRRLRVADPRSRPLHHDAGISDDQRREWEQNGVLILRNFFDADRINEMNDEIQRLWDNREEVSNPLVIDLFEGPQRGRQFFRDAPGVARHMGQKLNDVYLVSSICRRLILDPALSRVLSALLDGPPLVCNSLNFEKGSEQPMHFDTYYMPPPVENKLVVTSICLEDWHHDAGPLEYYLGSHKIPPYRFSNGKISANQEEMPAATRYVRDEIERRQLQRETFMGNMGDVLIWHAQLYHGGSQIRDKALTRRSLVTHYWRYGDIKPGRCVAEHDNGYFIKRHHQPVPRNMEK